MTDKITIIAKNNSGDEVEIEDLGIIIANGDQNKLNESVIPLCLVYESDNLKTLVEDGTLVMNDGTSDLSAADGVHFIEVWNNIQTTEPRMFNTFIVSTNGDDTNDGKSFRTAVQSISHGMSLAQAVTPTTDHKVLYSIEARNFGDLINNTTIGNVANLVVDMKSAYFEDVDLTRKTNLITRRIIGNVLLGNGSNFNVWGDVGYSTATTIGFVAGTHNNTILKVNRVGTNVTISFAGITGGSNVHVEINHYAVAGFDEALETLLSTIPDDVTVTGFIGTHNFVDTPIIEDLEKEVNQLQGHNTFTIVGDDLLAEGDKLPHPHLAMPARAMAQILPSSDRTTLVFVAKAGGADKNGTIFEIEYDAAASPVNVSVNGDTVTIGLGAATNTIRQLADAIEAHTDFPTSDWYVDPMHYAGHSTVITSSLATVSATAAEGIDAPTTDYFQLTEVDDVQLDRGYTGKRLPGLYKRVDYPAGMDAGRFRVKAGNVGNNYGFWKGADYPATGGPASDIGSEVFMPTAGGVLGMVAFLDQGFWDVKLYIDELAFYGAMHDRVRYIWSTQPAGRGDEGGSLVANPYDFNADLVIHDNLVVHMYQPDDLDTAHHGNIAFNTTSQSVHVGSKKYRVFETLLGYNPFVDMLDEDFVEIDIRLDVDHDVRILRNLKVPMAQDDWGDITNLHQGTQAKTWYAVDIYHPTVSNINKHLNDLDKRVRALENA